MRKFLAVALLALILPACKSVDKTAHCVETRYGEVVNKQMDEGLNFLGPINDATCFDLTDQTFPDTKEGVATITVQSNDPVSFTAEVQIIWAYDPETLYEIFLAKRTEDQVEAEIQGAIRSGVRNAINKYSIEEVFSRREEVELAVHDAIQAQLEDRAILKNTYLRDMEVPERIENARIAATETQNELLQAERQFQIDSIRIASDLLEAKMGAEKAELAVRAATVTAEAFELQKIQVFAEGLSKICGVATTCVIGSNTMEKFLAGGR